MFDWINLICLVVGGILTFLGGFFTNFYQNKREDKKYKRKKKEEVYLELYRALANKDLDGVYSKKFLLDLLAKVDLYSCRNIRIQFYETFIEKDEEKYNEKFIALEKMIKKDLDEK